MIVPDYPLALDLAPAATRAGRPLHGAVEDLVVADSLEAQFPACGGARGGILSNKREQLDAGACAELEALGPLAKQHDRALDLLPGAGDLGGQLGRGLWDRGLRLLCHTSSFPGLQIVMQAGRAGCVARRGSPALQSVADRAAFAWCRGPSRSSRPEKQLTIAPSGGAIGRFFKSKRAVFAVCAP